MAAALPHPLSSPPAAPPHAPRDDQNGCGGGGSDAGGSDAGGSDGSDGGGAGVCSGSGSGRGGGGGETGPATFFNPPKHAAVDALADGTAHYLGVAALARGFEVLEAVGGPAAIAAHTRALAAELRSRLRSLRHADGRRAVVLYGAWAGGEGGAGEGGAGEGGAEGAVRTSLGGPTVAFNVVRHDGSVVGYAEVGKLAALHRPPIQLRTGCCCNPGGCQALLGLSEAGRARREEL